MKVTTRPRKARMRKASIRFALVLSVFAALAAFVPAQAQAAGIWVYVQYWRAANESESMFAQIACYSTASSNYPGRNHECRRVPGYIQLWVEY
ncbi:hypothetical protein [Lentzea sp. NPDC059081]|uniref:hypothetical protein n=1 Tax=Lentzea sp. NPDC059081 TaxID=3346719 RepID=UPI0036AB69B2